MSRFFLVAKDELFIAVSEMMAGIVRLRVNEISQATDILVVGGDGVMLSAIRDYGLAGKPFCGLNLGHTGFLMNEPTKEVIRQIMAGRTQSVFVRLLQADLFDRFGEQKKSPAYAFNDFYFERASPQAANIRVTVGEKVRFNPLVCDGVLVCTQAGSTAYNASAHGGILPLKTEAMVLTGICPAIFHRWQSSLLAVDSKVLLEAQDIEKRPVRFIADGREIPGIVKAEISYSDIRVELKFAESEPFEEKVLALSFGGNL